MNNCKQSPFLKALRAAPLVLFLSGLLVTGLPVGDSSARDYDNRGFFDRLFDVDDEPILGGRDNDRRERERRWERTRERREHDRRDHDRRMWDHDRRDWNHDGRADRRWDPVTKRWVDDVDRGHARWRDGGHGYGRR